MQSVSPATAPKGMGSVMTGAYKIFVCPSEVIPTGGSPNFQYTHYVVNTRFTHYCSPARKTVSAREPSSVILQTDSNKKDNYSLNTDGRASERHGALKTNSSYLDGHADFRRLSTDTWLTEKLNAGYSNPCGYNADGCNTNCGK